MDTVVIKYNAGNLRSVEFALSRLGVEPVFSDEAETILKAQRIIFPGVGEASSAMKYLRERQLDEVILAAKQPFLGICLGMQLMCKHSEENDTTCLGIFDESVKKFNPADPALKVPQIGWNTIANLNTPVFTDIPEDSYCYFVHGYYASKGEHTIATTDYGGLYSAALNKANYYGVQFHPEKSAAIGQKIIENFLKIE
ncbi:MAG: imidazole glycerol phosphate synthase subunit HisH [Chitinophagia bacterium]|nr:imidazole glycerol phosphate synthase subunit HisH [Chitinophagia bacterium]